MEGSQSGSAARVLQPIEVVHGKTVRSSVSAAASVVSVHVTTTASAGGLRRDSTGW